MKKIAIVCSLFIILWLNIGAVSGTEQEDIIDLASVIMNSNLEINKWQVTMKEQITKEKAQDIIKELKNSYFVTTKKDENSIKYIVDAISKNGDIKVAFNIIIPNSVEYNAEVMAVLRGSFWSESVEQAYVTAVKDLPDYLFTNLAKKYSCLTTEKDAKIDSDGFFDEITRKLNLKHILIQQDTVKNVMHEKIIYGYSSLWGGKFIINNRPTNIHMAIKPDKNGDAKLTIGTPILITEY